MFPLIISLVVGSVASVYLCQMKIVKWLCSKYDIKYSHGTPGDKTVYLTINNVPYEKQTFSKILDTLNNRGVKATFFVISSLVNYENVELLISAVKQGHHLANNGKYNRKHTNLSYEELKEEIEDCEVVINNIYRLANEQNESYNSHITQPVIKYYRPPCGYINDTIDEYCKENNYKIVLGNIYTCDPHIPFGCINNLYVTTFLKENDIISIHDRNWTAESLDDLIMEINNKEYIITNLI